MQLCKDIYISKLYFCKILRDRELLSKWKNCNKIDIGDQMTLMYICLFFNINFIIFIFLFYMISSESGVLKDQF